MKDEIWLLYISWGAENWKPGSNDPILSQGKAMEIFGMRTLR